MTRISGFDPTSAADRRESHETHRREGERDLTGGLKRFHTAGGDDLHSGTELGDGRAAREEGDRMRRFGESLKRADAAPDATEDDTRAPKLLALAEPGRPAVAVAGHTSHADGAAERRADALAQSERIARMVEGALRAELSPVPGRPLTLSFEALRPGETAGTIGGVSLTLHDGVLDVVLRRTADGTQDALFIAAAQSLAERLGQRFPKRVVRVLDEGGSSGGAQAADGARAPVSVFDLFAKPDGRA